jgi:hypothetical protein
LGLGEDAHDVGPSSDFLVEAFEHVGAFERPKLRRWMGELDRLLAANAEAPARERLTLIRIFEELRALGYEGGYDAVRRYASAWAKSNASATATGNDSWRFKNRA